MGTDPQPGLASGRRLSFSVDRILSKEVGGRQPSRPSLPSTIPNTDVGVCRDWCCDRPAVLRCCQPSHHHHQTYFQPHHHHFLQQPHAPKPIRPFPSKFQVKVSYRGPESEDLLAAAGKRKRSWSRAVFSSLQRKGLEKRFQIQQYITKPDRRQLAATLGLTDAQVKVWFQNRRMKWRHTKEMKGAGVPCQQRLTASGQPPQGQV